MDPNPRLQTQRRPGSSAQFPAQTRPGMLWPFLSPKLHATIPKPTKNTHKEKSKRNYKYGIHIASHMARFIGLTALAMRSITVW